MHTIYAVGIGPGGASWITPEAMSILEEVDEIIGYALYCNQIKDIFPLKIYTSNGMRQEVNRCTYAIEEAEKGRSIAVISSGDAAIYGMASLLMEIVADRKSELHVEVVAGITSAVATGAQLGSPLTNDFSVISLSNLLTKEETIIKRLKGAANSDMVTVLYNPKSKRRVKLIEDTKEIFLKASSDPKGPVVGYCKNVGREGLEKWIGRLIDLNTDDIDMLTTIIIGNSFTDIINNQMVTRRGYSVS